MATETADISPQAPISPDTTSAVLPSGGNEGASAPAQGAPPQQQNPQDRNWAELRNKVTDLETKYKPWEQLGLSPEDVQRHTMAYQQVRSEATQLGRELGYPDDEVAEAIHMNAAQALFLLRKQYDEAVQQQQQQGAEQPDLNQLIEQKLQEQIAPIQEWREQQQQVENIRMTDAGNALFERTVHQLAAEMFKKEGFDIADVSEDEKFMINSAISHYLSGDQEVHGETLRDLKYNGKTGGVQKAFNEVVPALDRYYLARQARGRAKIAPARGAAPGAPAPAGKPSLDEMIDNPALINAKYK